MKKSPFLTLDSARVEIARLAAALAKSSAADPVNPNEPEVKAQLSLSEANALIINLRVQIAALQAENEKLKAALAEAKKAKGKPADPADPNAKDPDDKGFQTLPAVTEESLAAAIHVEKDFRKQNAMVRTLAAMQTVRAIEQVKSSKRRNR